MIFILSRIIYLKIFSIPKFFKNGTYIIENYMYHSLFTLFPSFLFLFCSLPMNLEQNRKKKIRKFKQQEHFPDKKFKCLFKINIYKHTIYNIN